jgi:hypothetical protein
MDLRHRGIQVLGWLAIIAACLPGYWLIRRFTVGQITDVWRLSYYVLLAALAIYLVYVGRRGLAFAKGQPQQKARFGWGRIVLGANLLWSRLDRVHARTIMDPFDPAGPTLITVYILLILWGIWIGVRPQERRSLDG